MCTSKSIQNLKPFKVSLCFLAFFEDRGLYVPLFTSLFTRRAHLITQKFKVVPPSGSFIFLTHWSSID
jgi:hypothetical protein